jgi:hypothetical protein
MSNATENMTWSGIVVIKRGKVKYKITILPLHVIFSGYTIETKVARRP